MFKHVRSLIVVAVSSPIHFNIYRDMIDQQDIIVNKIAFIAEAE